MDDARGFIRLGGELSHTAGHGGERFRLTGTEPGGMQRRRGNERGAGERQGGQAVTRLGDVDEHEAGVLVGF